MNIADTIDDAKRAFEIAGRGCLVRIGEDEPRYAKVEEIAARLEPHADATMLLTAVSEAVERYDPSREAAILLEVASGYQVLILSHLRRQRAGDLSAHGLLRAARFRESPEGEGTPLMENLLAGLAAQAAAAPAPVMLGLVFLGGVLSSASPCVLAAVPLVVATVGGAGTTRARAAMLTAAFVTGLAVCFTALGAVAALSGRLLGDIGVAWPLLLSAVLAVMGLHLAGVLHLPMPRVDAARLGKAGIAGAFALGALTGTLSSPCATPILVVILSLVAFERKVLWGTTLLFAYSAGHVVLLLAAGLATGFVTAFIGSRAAVWAGRVQRAFGWVLVALGVSVGATALRRVLAA